MKSWFIILWPTNSKMCPSTMLLRSQSKLTSIHACFDIKWHQWLDHWSTNLMTQTSRYCRRWCAYMLKVSTKIWTLTSFGTKYKKRMICTLYCAVESSKLTIWPSNVIDYTPKNKQVKYSGYYLPTEKHTVSPIHNSTLVHHLKIPYIFTKDG